MYFSAYDALHQGNSSHRRLELRLPNVSSIGKVVWSCFDFMCGPELKFVWEVTSSSSVSPVNLSGEEGSVNDAESLDSSMTTQSAQYEDIDDPLESNLTSTDLLDDMFLDDSMYRECHLSSRSSYALHELRYLDEFMVDSHCSTTDSNCTMTDSQMQESASASRSVSAATTVSMNKSAEWLPQPENDDSSVAPDMMVGTPMEMMNISNLLTNNLTLVENQTLLETFDSAKDGSESSTTGASKTSTASFTKLLEDDGNGSVGVAPYVDDNEGGKAANALTTSCVDSGIGGTISTHSELSGLCMSPSVDPRCNPPKAFPVSLLKTRQPQSAESTPGSFDDDVVSFLDLPVNHREDSITDEVFVSKFVLAEQVFSTQLPSNPLMHKITVVPSRNLLVGSFIFSFTAQDGSKTIHALSFLMGCCKQEWYLDRQSFFESAVLDAVPKIKASMLAEDWDDVIVRANAELTRLIHLVTVLDRHPLVSDARPLLNCHQK